MKFQLLSIWYRMREKLLFKIAWALPKSIVYYCGIRIVSDATTGQYANTEVPALTAMEAIQRFEKPLRKRS